MGKNIYVLTLLSLLLGCDSSSNSDEENSLGLIVGEHTIELQPENADLETELTCPTTDALVVIETGGDGQGAVSLKGYVEYGADNLSYFFSNLEEDGELTNFSSVSQIIDDETGEVKTSAFSSNEIDVDFDFQGQEVIFDPNIVTSSVTSPPVLKIEGNIFDGGTWAREGENLFCSGFWKLEV